MDRIRFHDQCSAIAKQPEPQRRERRDTYGDSPHCSGADTSRMSASAPIHTGAAGRWHSFTLMQQLAHLGSEVERSIRAHETGNAPRFDNALARALELFDLTATDQRWKGLRRREILRTRDELFRMF